MRIKAATFVAAVLLAALLVNHAWVGFQAGRIAAAANVGVELPGSLKFLVKLDHLAVDFGYVLVPFTWIVAFLGASTWVGLRDFFGRSKAVRAPDGGLGEP